MCLLLCFTQSSPQFCELCLDFFINLLELMVIVLEFIVLSPYFVVIILKHAILFFYFIQFALEFMIFSPKICIFFAELTQMLLLFLNIPLHLQCKCLFLNLRLIEHTFKVFFLIFLVYFLTNDFRDLPFRRLSFFIELFLY